MGYYNSFVIKIWAEDDKETIRGHMRHVGTQEEMYFLSLDKMIGFIMSHLGPSANHPFTHEEEEKGGVNLSQDSGIIDE